MKYFYRPKAPVCFAAINQPLVSAMHEEGAKLHAALQVMVLTPSIREWLAKNEPQALEQALDALQ